MNDKQPQELTMTECSRSQSKLRNALEDGPVRIIWKEQKPNGKVVFSAIVNKEEKE
jgi:hypothetical protein